MTGTLFDEQRSQIISWTLFYLLHFNSCPPLELSLLQLVSVAFFPVTEGQAERTVDCSHPIKFADLYHTSKSRILYRY